jgi:hypothetical protein
MDASARSDVPVTDLEMNQAAEASAEAMAMQAEVRRANALVVKHPQLAVDEVYHSTPVVPFPAKLTS